MMILIFAITCAAVVGYSYWSKKKFYKRMQAQRAREAEFREKLTKFGAQQAKEVKDQMPHAKAIVEMTDRSVEPWSTSNDARLARWFSRRSLRELYFLGDETDLEKVLRHAPANQPVTIIKK